jgi:MFS family permease
MVGGLLLKDAPLSEEEKSQVRQPYWQEVFGTFRFTIVRENRTLFLLFLSIMINATAWQVTFPYLLIYIEHYLGYDKGTMGMIMGAVLIITAISTIPLGMLVDRMPRRPIILWMAILSGVTALLFSFARGIPFLIFSGTLTTVTMAGYGIVAGAWLKDLYPAQQRGQFQGVRMVFMVMLPMVIGPAIGSFLIRMYGAPTIMNGEAGFIPTPVLYYVSMVINLLAVIPILPIPKQQEKEIVA